MTQPDESFPTLSDLDLFGEDLQKAEDDAHAAECAHELAMEKKEVEFWAYGKARMIDAQEDERERYLEFLNSND